MRDEPFPEEDVRRFLYDVNLAHLYVSSKDDTRGSVEGFRQDGQDFRHGEQERQEMWYLAGRARDAGEFRSAFGGAWVSPEQSERRRRLNAGCKCAAPTKQLCALCVSAPLR